MATGRVPTTANSPLTAKGDLFGYSTTQARVPVGSDGETLVADSSATTGLRWQGNYAAGKNKIINGDFSIWQRGTSFTLGTNAYNADRWASLRDGNGTVTVSQQTFTPGAAPVAGYEGQYFAQIACTSVGTTTYFTLEQPIEDVRTFAGQTVTLSFWARVAAGPTTTGPYVRLNQNFGTGGSSSVTTQSGGFVFTTSWARYTYTVALPSVSGKTIGANSNLAMQFILPSGGVTGTLQFWGFQLEAGSVATAFQTATGTLAGELAACQRYYWRSANTSAYATYGNGMAASGTAAQILVNFPQAMRAAPTVLEFSTLQVNDSLTVYAVTVLTQSQSCSTTAILSAGVASGLTTNRFYHLGNNNSTAGYIAFGAEL